MFVIVKLGYPVILGMKLVKYLAQTLGQIYISIHVLKGK